VSRPSAHPDLRRVAVVGSSCSGKTTFSRLLARRLAHRHIELHELYWRPGWTSAPAEEFRTLVDGATSADAWIADGSYTKVSDLVWGRATALIWLDVPFRVTFGRAFARTLRRLVTRETLFAGNRESPNVADPDWIPWWVLRTHHRRRREYERMLEDPAFGHLGVVRLRSAGASVAFVARLPATARSAPALRA